MPSRITYKVQKNEKYFVMVQNEKNNNNNELAIAILCPCDDDILKGILLSIFKVSYSKKKNTRCYFSIFT